MLAAELTEIRERPNGRFRPWAIQKPQNPDGSIRRYLFLGGGKRFFVMAITAPAQVRLYSSISPSDKFCARTGRRNPMARIIRATRWFFRRNKKSCSAIEFSAFGL
jgi:hypothetical protein